MKDLFGLQGLSVFWISETAGWGLGYEEGMDTGGSFYSSGPEVSLEPWLGAWLDGMVEVRCEEPEIPLFPLQVLPQEAGKPVCTRQEACLTRQDCPPVQEQYRKLQSFEMGSIPAQNIIAQLRDKETLEIFHF